MSIPFTFTSKNKKTLSYKACIYVEAGYKGWNFKESFKWKAGFFKSFLENPICGDGKCEGNEIETCKFDCSDKPPETIRDFICGDTKCEDKNGKENCDC